MRKNKTSLLSGLLLLLLGASLAASAVAFCIDELLMFVFRKALLLVR